MATRKIHFADGEPSGGAPVEQVYADNLPASSAPATVDTLAGATDTGKAVMKAASAAAARTAIGAGTSSFDGNYSSLKGAPTIPAAYTLPAAAANAIGGVKKGAAVAATDVTDAATAKAVGATVNALIASLKAAGVLA